ncbi:unnamed protein product [Haemonchus placei]|uniref:Uncharacterized protein n=1 Tax=Haemonchus placei TaxID=6290 RepID=A0A3P7W9K3_HAEPC|nr:unnamed protein product [Haemonchus placei]
MIFIAQNTFTKAIKLNRSISSIISARRKLSIQYFIEKPKKPAPLILIPSTITVFVTKSTKRSPGNMAIWRT